MTTPTVPPLITAPAAPLTTTLDIDWYFDVTTVRDHMNGPLHPIAWQFKDQYDIWMKEGDDPNHSRTCLHYFEAAFPSNSMRRIIHLTNKKLRAREVDEIDMPELLKFFGTCILITKFEFASRRDLWATKGTCTYIPPACIGEKTGMLRNNFDKIWSAITFSEQMEERPDHISHARHRWQLVDDFVNNFNDHPRRGTRIEQTRLRQVSPVESNKPPEHVEVDQNCPAAVSLYFEACRGIDRHNRYRQDNLNLEKKLHTKQWDMQVNMSIVGMIMVDAYLLFRGCTGGEITQDEFNKRLLAELIENGYAWRTVQHRSIESVARSAETTSMSTGLAGRGLHITPTKQVFHELASTARNFRQAKCHNCSAKTIMVFLECRLDPKIEEVGAAYCAPTTGRTCYRSHMEQFH